MGYDINEIPDEVLNQKQNITVKFSPVEPLVLELITHFSVNQSFDEVFKDEKEIRVKVLNYNDLITSKI